MQRNKAMLAFKMFLFYYNSLSQLVNAGVQIKAKKLLYINVSKYEHCQVQTKQKHRLATSLYCRNGISRRFSRILEKEREKEKVGRKLRARSRTSTNETLRPREIHSGVSLVVKITKEGRNVTTLKNVTAKCMKRFKRSKTILRALIGVL